MCEYVTHVLLQAAAPGPSSGSLQAIVQPLDELDYWAELAASPGAAGGHGPATHEFHDVCHTSLSCASTGYCCCWHGLCTWVDVSDQHSHTILDTVTSASSQARVMRWCWWQVAVLLLQQRSAATWSPCGSSWQRCQQAASRAAGRVCRMWATPCCTLPG